MVDLAILADDLTGSFDTGIKFAKKGLKTQIFIDVNFDVKEVEPDTQVLVIDTESRHMTAENAYHTLYELTKKCMSLPVKTFYKKTDSALRGHIGSELAALYDALKVPVHFIPAFPDQGRTTQAGVHYINGIPVAESIFHEDPFNPVIHSNVRDVLKEETNLSSLSVPLTFFLDSDSAIFVYDAVTNQDILQVYQNLAFNTTTLALAGCAGFADCLASHMTSSISYENEMEKTEKLCIICGSITDVSKRQLHYAQQHGCARIILDEEQMLCESFFDSKAGTSLWTHLKDSFSQNSVICIDVNSENALTTTASYADKNNIALSDIPGKIAFRLSEIAKKAVHDFSSTTLFIVGGDTLFSYIKSLASPKIELVCEPINGMVLLKISQNGESMQLLSKSGGFGTENLILEAAQKILIK